MINSVTLIGRLGQDPEVKVTEGGTQITNFSIAVNEVWKDASGEKNEVAHWFRCVAFGSLAEVCGKYLTKGSKVGIAGTLRQNKWETDDGEKRSSVEIRVVNMEFMGGDGNGNGKGKGKSAPKGKGKAKTSKTSDDDAPF